MPLALLALFVLLTVISGAVGYWFGSSYAPQTTDGAAVAERDDFIEQLRELAWQHRDVSPELSTIVIDEITQHHRRGHGQLPGGPSS